MAGALGCARLCLRVCDRPGGLNGDGHLWPILIRQRGPWIARADRALRDRMPAVSQRRAGKNVRAIVMPDTFIMRQGAPWPPPPSRGTVALSIQPPINRTLTPAFTAS